MPSTLPISVLAFAGALLVSTLAPSYYRAGNIPVLLSIFWLFFTSTCIAINTAGWHDSTTDKWRPFCEISIRLVYASAFGFQCCSALLLRRLEAIAATRYVSMTKAAKRRRIGIELGVGLLLPVLYVALAVVNQGHRYDIIQTFGPVISIFPSVLSVIFSTLPILLVSVIATVYAILCSYWLYLRRRQLSAVLSSSGSGINVSQYVRLFGLSCVEILWTVPVNWTVQMQNLFNRNPGGSILYPYTSWADVHYDFGRIGQYPIELLQLSPVGRRNLPILYLGSLSSAISCFLFFGFLGTSTGFTRDIVTHFSKWWNAIMPPKRLPKREDALSRRRPSFSEDLSHPPLSPNEELKMKHLDDSRVDDIHIEVLVERERFEEPHLHRTNV